MTLTGLILAALYSGVRLGTRASETTERYAADNEELRAVQGFLRRQLAQIYPLLYENQGEREVLFRGKRRALYFTVISPVRAELGGPYIAGIELRRSPRGRQLVYRYWPASPDLKEPLSPPLDAPSKVLVEGVDEVDLGYYGRQDDVVAWQDTWNEALHLPSRVRLRLNLRGSRDWPELMVPIRVEIDENSPQLVLQPPESADESDLDEEDLEGAGEEDFVEDEDDEYY